MALPGFQHHRKFARLKHILQEPTPHVWGYMECLWSVAYQNGDPFIGDATDVEIAAQYPGPAGKFCAAALQVGLIDELEESTYQIHDLYENAPAYVKKRFERDQTRKNKYSPRKRASGNSQPNSGDGRLIPPNLSDLGPSPELGATNRPDQDSPDQDRTTPPTPRMRGAGASETIASGFAEFWASYPRKRAKAKAIKAWNKLAPDEALRKRIQDALNTQKRSPQWTKDEGEFIPHPASWLNGRRWEDEGAAPAPAQELAAVRAEQQRQRLQALRPPGKTVNLGDALAMMRNKEENSRGETNCQPGNAAAQ